MPLRLIFLTVFATLVLAAGTASAGSRRRASKPAPPPPPPEPAVQLRETQRETVQLSVGQSRTILVKGLSRISVEDPRVADAQILNGEEVLVTARGAGETPLLVWIGKGERATYRVRVLRNGPAETTQQLKTLLKI